MINLADIRDHVIIPALSKIGHAEPAAVRLVIGTGLIESNYQYLAQQGGPALGFWQMEPETCQDIWDSYLTYQPAMRTNILSLLALYGDKFEQLSWNLQYAAAMCRIKYLRAPQVLPHVDDLEGLAQYWKLIYNSPLGAGDPAMFIQRATAYGLMNL